MRALPQLVFPKCSSAVAAALLSSSYKGLRRLVALCYDGAAQACC
jgi:hypothetical protein